MPGEGRRFDLKIEVYTLLIASFQRAKGSLGLVGIYDMDLTLCGNDKTHQCLFESLETFCRPIFQ